MESETIEFKQGLGELKAGLVSMAAILNKHGAGELWFGVRNDGVCVGIDVSAKTLRDVSQAIGAHIEPKVFPYITKEHRDEKTCIKVSFAGGEAPYFAYGRAYMRVADEDRKLSAKELENLILTKAEHDQAWDGKASRLTIGDLDEEKLKTFVSRAGLEWDDPVHILEKLGLFKDDQLANAAPLFFARSAPTQLPD